MIEISCPTCGKSVPAEATVCPHDGTPLATVESTAPHHDPLVGAQLGDYVIEARLGEGGMGVVYRGVHPVIGKAVAIKVLRWELARDPVQMQRLISEARSVNAIRHRGIVDIFGFGAVPDGRQYLVMELLDGTSLDQLLAHAAPLPPIVALPILEEILDVLQAAHGAGVIHRDLKPSNVFIVTPQHGVRYVKLLDFGLAKQADTPGGSTPQTRASMTIGTPQYMAPEQARGEPVGPFTDLYAFGVLAFEVLTGRLLFTAPTPFEVIYHHLHSQPPMPSSIVPGLLPALDELVLRLLAKKPKDRPESAAAVRLELSRLSSGGALAPTPPGSDLIAKAIEAARSAVLAPLPSRVPRERPQPTPPGEASGVVVEPTLVRRSNPRPIGPLPEPGVEAAEVERTVVWNTSQSGVVPARPKTLPTVMLPGGSKPASESLAEAAPAPAPAAPAVEPAAAPDEVEQAWREGDAGPSTQEIAPLRSRGRTLIALAAAGLAAVAAAVVLFVLPSREPADADAGAPASVVAAPPTPPPAVAEPAPPPPSPPVVEPPPVAPAPRVVAATPPAVPPTPTPHAAKPTRPAAHRDPGTADSTRSEPPRVERKEPSRAERKEPPRAERNEPSKPRVPDVRPLRARLARIQGEWQFQRAGRSPEDVRIFDLTLEGIGRELARGTPESLVEASNGLDEFEKSALSR